MSVPGYDDRRRLAPRIERVEYDNINFKYARVRFKDDIDIAPFRKNRGEFRLLAGSRLTRFRETANTGHWQWASPRTVLLTNPVSSVAFATPKPHAIYLEGNLRADRRFALRPRTRVNRLLVGDFAGPLLSLYDWNTKDFIAVYRSDMACEFIGGTGDLTIRMDDIFYYYNEGSPFYVEEDKAFYFQMIEDVGDPHDYNHYKIPADTFARLTEGFTNQEIYEKLP